MHAEIVYLGVVLTLALGSFVRGWLRIDLTALLVMLSLLVPWRHTPAGGWAGVLTLEQALSGFGSPAVAMVASMFVMSAAMEHTRAAGLLGQRVLAAGSRSELSLQITLLSVVTLFSALVSDTTTVLVWMPLVLAVCRERGYASSRMLLPLAYASLLGGQWTLIGTRSNVIASDYLRSRSGDGLDFLAFTPVAMCVWAVSMIFFVTIGRRLLPKGAAEAPLADRYQVQEYLTEVLAAAGSDVVGRTLDDLRLEGSHQVTVLGVIRDGEHLPPAPNIVMQAEDVLIVQGRISRISDLLSQPGMSILEELRVGDKTLRSIDLRMVEALIAPQSPLEGRTLEELDFAKRYGLSVLALGRAGRPIAGRPVQQKLLAGDSMLLVGHDQMIDQLREEPGLMLLETRPVPIIARAKAYWTLGLLAFVVLASAVRLLQPAVAMLFAAAAAVLIGCISLREAYRAIDWRTIVVLGGMIPFGLALETSGTAELLAESAVGTLQGFGPHAVFAALLLLTVLFTQIVENAAAAAILAPIAYQLALSCGADPAPFLLGMAICTSAGFSTPWAHESTLLVLGPGRYEMRHYLALGLPFTAITWIVTVVALPWFFPLVG